MAPTRIRALDVSGNPITHTGTPIVGTDAVNKDYCDGVAGTATGFKQVGDPNWWDPLGFPFPNTPKTDGWRIVSGISRVTLTAGLLEANCTVTLPPPSVGGPTYFVPMFSKTDVSIPPVTMDVGIRGSSITAGSGSTPGHFEIRVVIETAFVDPKDYVFMWVAFY